jgi:hypothetical protein
MRLSRRNLLLGFISVLLICVIYFFIGSLSHREPIIVEKPPQLALPDSNMLRSGQIGRIGDVNIAELDNPVYKHLNEAGDVDREFTFKKLLRAEGDKWLVEKPQISFFNSDFSVVMSADKADIQTETVLKQPRPKDAALSGNVIVHIQPKSSSSSLRESFVYLDTISFESDSSRSFTSGPVKFVSDNIQLTGKAMEFVYNAEKRRLEFLKIDDLNSLKLTVPAKSLLFQPAVGNADNTASAPQPASYQNMDKTSQNQDGNLPAGPPSGGLLYRWVFNKFVSIDCPNQVILTDSFLINNILFKQSEPNTVFPAESSAEIKTETAAKTPKTSSSAEMMDVNITCKGGILITPMDSPRLPPSINSTDTVTAGRGLAGLGDTKNKTVIVGRKLVFDAFSNLAVLDGDCFARMSAAQGSPEHRFLLTAQRIETAFTGLPASSAADKNDGNLNGSLKYVKADGGIVQVAVEKLEQNKIIGFTKIKCSSFNFDPANQNLHATGPGLIAIDNSRLTKMETDALKPSKDTASKFSLQKPCYAVIGDFASLEYNLKTGRILAQAGKNRMNVGFLPIIDGKEGLPTRATVGRVEAKLSQTAAGKTDLVKLFASDGVTYDEQSVTKAGKNKNIQLIGSDLIYDVENPAKPLITVWGNKSWPCFLNGVPVDGIEYQLSTGSLKQTKILAPAVLQ